MSSIESGFAGMRDAAPFIADWTSCPWCLTSFNGAGATAKGMHVMRCAGGEDNAVRLARAYSRGVVASAPVRSQPVSDAASGPATQTPKQQEQGMRHERTAT